jgi:hypothetical protein
MTDAWDYNESDDQTQNNGPKPLRDAYAAQKKQNEELMARLAKLEAVNQRNQVADMIEAQGVARSAAQYYSGDADPDKVSAFVNDMRAAFGSASAPQATPVSTPAVDASDAQKLQSMMQAGAQGAAPGNADVALSAMNNPDASTADRIAAFQAFARTQQQ